MSLKFSPARSLPTAVDAIILAVASDKCSDRALKARGLPVAALRTQGFTGAADQVAYVTDSSGRSTIVIGAHRFP